VIRIDSTCWPLIVFLTTLCAPRAHAQSRIVTWGSIIGDSAWNDGPFVQLAGANNHSLALRADGSVVVWGEHSLYATLPALPPGVTYVEVSGGDDYSLVRRSDGQVFLHG
jgi:alpha-tubulin suppressor-like RCC1 family protein